MPQIVVTDEMVQAARRKMPARWSMQDLHDAIEAAPPIELAFSVELTEEQRAAFDAKLDEAIAARGSLARVYPAMVHLRGEPGPELPLPPVDGCVSSELRTGAPICAEPLGGITEIAAQLGAGRSTVVGWTKRADKIGMPPPLAELAAVEAWYRAWKNGSADAAA